MFCHHGFIKCSKLGTRIRAPTLSGGCVIALRPRRHYIQRAVHLRTLEYTTANHDVRVVCTCATYNCACLLTTSECVKLRKRIRAPKLIGVCVRCLKPNGTKINKASHRVIVPFTSVQYNIRQITTLYKRNSCATYNCACLLTTSECAKLSKRIRAPKLIGVCVRCLKPNGTKISEASHRVIVPYTSVQ